jgi:DNA-binding transcriptional ArsR family regulator
MANGKYQKVINNFLILQTLRLKHLSRKELSTELGLQASTVTYAISRLEDEGLIDEIGEDVNQGMGRKRTLLGLRGDFGCVFGIELLVNHFRANILDINGNTLFEISQSFTNLDNIKDYATVERFEQIVKYVLSFLEENAKDLNIIAACIGIAGTVDSSGNKINSSWTQGLRDYDGTDFIKNFDYPIFFENDANCAAYSHLNSRDDTFLYTLVQQYPAGQYPEGVPPIGIGIGVVIDGKLRRGFNHKAGEFSSFLYRGDVYDKQLALSNIELEQLESNDDLLKKFLVELFGNLFFVESVIDPRIIYLGGSLGKWKKISKKILDTEFKNSKYLGDHNTFVFIKPDHGDVAKGAGLLVLNHLFTLPEASMKKEEWVSLDTSLIRES